MWICISFTKINYFSNSYLFWILWDFFSNSIYIYLVRHLIEKEKNHKINESIGKSYEWPPRTQNLLCALYNYEIICALIPTLILEITNWIHSPYTELKRSFKQAFISGFDGNDQQIPKASLLHNDLRKDLSPKEHLRNSRLKWRKVGNHVTVELSLWKNMGIDQYN